MRFLLILALAASTLPARAQQSRQQPAIATLTVAYTYLWADQGGYRVNLNGWNVRPSVLLGRGYSVFFSSTNYYGANRKGSLNAHGYTLGVAKSVFTTPHFKPALFLESGDVRVSSAGAITNEALVATGASVSIPLRPWVSLMVLPAEYVFLYPHADWRNDLNAKVGLTFPLGHR
jgi:hypothetical protein